MGRKFDHLADIEVFVAIADQGSITAAAVMLSTTPSVVSRTLSRLESRLGAQLFRRTTRSIGLTEAGQLYLDYTHSALAQIDEAEKLIQGKASTVVGRVRLSVPTTFGHYRLPDMISRFSALYPQVKIDINITNRNVDLVAEGYDFAIRLGVIKDSRLIARKIEDASLCLVASPHYIQKNGMPETFEQLAAHQCITFLIPSTGRPTPWLFMKQGEKVDWMPSSTIEVTDDVLGVVTLAEKGLGVCQTYDFIVQERLAQGTLVEVLPVLRGRSRSFSLLYTAQKNMTAAARAFKECIV